MRMNTKKYFAGLMVCVLVMLLGQCAFAESIFPDLSQFKPTASEEEYPSLSVICGIDPILIEETEDNKVVYYHDYVDEDDYYKFGAALQERGYTNEEVRQVEESVIVSLVKGNNRFTVVYEYYKGQLDVVYPAGAVIETKSNDAAFANYSEFKKGDIIDIPKFGKIKITNCVLNNDGYEWVYSFHEYDPNDMFSERDIERLTYSQTKDISGQIVLEGTFTNATKFDMNGIDNIDNIDGNSIYCVYINGDTRYVFTEGDFGAIKEEKYGGRIFYMNYSKSVTRRIPLFKKGNTSPLAIVINVPVEVQTSREGTLALVIESSKGMYYMKLRENGKDL